MSQHDALLDELGLAPLWVRRDRAATTTADDHAPLNSAADEAPAARALEPGQARGAVRASTADVQLAGVAQEPGANTSARRRALSNESASTDEFESSAPEATAAQRVEHSHTTRDAQGFDGVARVAPLDAPEFAGSADVSTLDFSALKARVSACTACGLCEKRTQTVFGVGDEQADWMIVGEAPGENEDRLGEPFVGQAGKLLDNMLRSLGLDRMHNVYIANVIKCRPPGNRDPQPDEVARCEPFLKQQVALIRPKVIVALGRFAAKTLLKSEASISSLRGRVHEYEGVPVIVSYHPAYLLRSLPEKSKAWTDLCLAQATYRKVTT